MKNDMLNGSVSKSLITLAIPIILQQLVWKFLHVADTWCASFFISDKAVAGIGATGLMWTFYCLFFSGISIGVEVVLSRYIASKRINKIPDIISTAVLSSLLLGIVALIFGKLTMPIGFDLLNISEELIPISDEYFTYILFGLPFLALQSCFSSILRTTGDTKRPSIIICIAGVLDLLLNILFIVVFKWGVKSVAIATALSNMFAAIATGYLLHKEKGLVKLYTDINKFNTSLFYKIIWIGAPTVLVDLIYVFLNGYIDSSVFALGVPESTSWVIIGYGDCPAQFIAEGFMRACILMMAHNHAAEKYKRTKEVFYKSLLWSGLFTIGVCIILALVSTPFVRLFTPDEKVLQLSLGYILYQSCIFQVFRTLYNVMKGALNALRHPKTQAVISIGIISILRNAFVRFLPEKTFFNICWAYPISWVLASVVAFVVIMWLFKTRIDPKIKKA